MNRFRFTPKTSGILQPPGASAKSRPEGFFQTLRVLETAHLLTAKRSLLRRSLLRRAPTQRALHHGGAPGCRQRLKRIPH